MSLRKRHNYYFSIGVRQPTRCGGPTRRKTKQIKPQKGALHTKVGSDRRRVVNLTQERMKEQRKFLSNRILCIKFLFQISISVVILYYLKSTKLCSESCVYSGAEYSSFNARTNERTKILKNLYCVIKFLFSSFVSNFCFQFLS